MRKQRGGNKDPISLTVSRASSMRSSSAVHSRAPLAWQKRLAAVNVKGPEHFPLTTDSDSPHTSGSPNCSALNHPKSRQLLAVQPGSRSTARGVGSSDGRGVGTGDGSEGAPVGAMEHLLEATSAQQRTDAVSVEVTDPAPATQVAVPDPSPLIVMRAVVSDSHEVS